MRVTVQLFSLAKDLAGFREKSVELPPGSNANDVFEELKLQNPRFADWQSSMRLAVNQEYVSNDHPLREGDEVAVIPPVSGG
jgi:molybdopterin converting factor subunit 1